MTNVIENAAHKTLDSMNDVKDDVTHAAKKQSSRLEKLAKIALRTLPLLPERTFEMVLDRFGLVKKPGGVALAAAFAGGFVAGGMTAALTTPFSGPVLRRKLGRSFKSWMNEGMAAGESVGEQIVDAEKKVVKGAKDLAKDAKHAIEHGADKVVELEESVEKKLKNGSTTSTRENHRSS